MAAECQSAGQEFTVMLWAFCCLLARFAEDVAKPLACQGSSVDVGLVTC